MLKLFTMLWFVFFVMFAVQNRDEFFNNVFAATVPAAIYSSAAFLCVLVYNAIK